MRLSHRVLRAIAPILHCSIPLSWVCSSFYSPSVLWNISRQIQCNSRNANRDEKRSPVFHPSDVKTTASSSASFLNRDNKSVPLLLQHLHCCLSQLERLYAQHEKKRSVGGTGGGLSESREERKCEGSGVGADVLSSDPQTSQEGEAIVDFFSRELAMGKKSLRAWRRGVIHQMYQKWVYNDKPKPEKSLFVSSSSFPSSSSSSSLTSLNLFLEHVARRVPLEVWEEAKQGEISRSKKMRGKPHEKKKEDKEEHGMISPIEDHHQDRNFKLQKKDVLFFYPRPQDTRFVHSCIKDLKAIISPFLTLSPPPRTTPRQRRRPSSNNPSNEVPSRDHTGGVQTLGFIDETNEDFRPYSYDSCSTFYATRFIPAGMCLMSIPTAAGFFMNPMLSSSLSDVSSLAPFSSSPIGRGDKVVVEDLQGQEARRQMPAPSTTTSTALMKGKDDTPRSRNGRGTENHGVQQGSSDDVDPYVLYFQQLEDLIGQMCFTADPPVNPASPTSRSPSSLLIEGSAACVTGHKAGDDLLSSTDQTSSCSFSSSASPLATSTSTVAPQSSPLCGYLSYLKESVVPCKNLPFIRTKEELFALLRPYSLSEEESKIANEPKSFNEDTRSHKEKGHGRREEGTTLSSGLPRSGALDESGLSTPSSTTPVTTLSSFSVDNKIKEEKQKHALENSVAYRLWSFFHEILKGEPLSPHLRQYFHLPPLPVDDDSAFSPSSSSSRTSPSMLPIYHWWVSLVLSRRLGPSCVIPLVDKLNHSPLPNCYYTMASPVPVEDGDRPRHDCDHHSSSEADAGDHDNTLSPSGSTSCSSSSSWEALRQSMSGLDVFHNLLAGVPSIYLYEPYFHVYALRDIHPGEPLTLCYQAPKHQMYRSANTLSMFSVMAEANRNDKSGGGEGLPKPTIATTSTAALLAHESSLRLRHPGKSCVDTLEGQGSWHLQWGFAPKDDAFFSSQDLMEMGILLTEKRVEERKLLFPSTS